MNSPALFLRASVWQIKYLNTIGAFWNATCMSIVGSISPETAHQHHEPPSATYGRGCPGLVWCIVVAHRLWCSSPDGAAAPPNMEFVYSVRLGIVRRSGVCFHLPVCIIDTWGCLHIGWKRSYYPGAYRFLWGGVLWRWRVWLTGHHFCRFSTPVGGVGAAQSLDWDTSKCCRMQPLSRVDQASSWIWFLWHP